MEEREPTVVQRSAPSEGAWVRCLAGVLGLLILGQALGYLFAGPSMVAFLGHHYDAHMTNEQGFAYLAAAVGALAGARCGASMRGALIPALILSVGLGLFGLEQLLTHSHSMMGDVGHVVQAALAALVAWQWRWRQ